MKAIYQIGAVGISMTDAVRTIVEVGDLTGMFPVSIVIEPSGTVIALNLTLAIALIDGIITEEQFISRSNLLK